jgi:DNA-binding transcriptional LysR family regulator
VVDLRRLRYFLAVAGERNFTRAAEQLHVAQPALSRQVRLLEEELGVALVRRTTHTFELTDAGRFLSERGPAVLDSADALWRTLRRFGAGELGGLVVAYGTSAGYDTAPRLLRAIAQTPVAAGEAVAIVAESTRVGMPRELVWLPLSPPAALPVSLLVRALDRAPVVERVLALSEDVAAELGWGDAAPR